VWTQWERDGAGELIAGRGAIVAEFFDAGVSRRRAWGERLPLSPRRHNSEHAISRSA
jgi:hypothetical protein